MSNTPRTDASAMVAFRDAVAKEVAAQYPRVDYLAGIVSTAIEKHAKMIGWDWYVDGPKTRRPGRAGGEGKGDK